MRPGRREALRGVLIAGAVLLGVFALFSFAGLRINLSASLPMGIYIVSHDRQSYVSFCLEGSSARLARDRGYREPGVCPDGATPLLKPVVAAAGDVVSVSGSGIAVNGRLLPNTRAMARDSQGRGLSVWPSGTYPVESATLWVVSTYSARSFDSRYFGPIPAGSVRERLRPLFVW